MQNQTHNPIGRLVPLIGILGLSAVIFGAAPRASFAQFGVPASQQLNNPAVSPYLNLTQPGLNPGIAYQTLVAPQIQFGNVLSSQQQQIGNLQSGMNANAVQTQNVVVPIASTPFAATGHPTTFLNTMGYFPLTTAGRR